MTTFVIDGSSKLKYALVAAILFLLIGNAYTYRLTQKIFGSLFTVSNTDGCPTTGGIILHTIVFFVLFYLVMQIPIDYTHLSLKSGCFHISDELYPEFLKILAKDIESKEPICFTEISKEEFTLFFDLDIQTNLNNINQDYLEKVNFSILKIVENFFPKAKQQSFQTLVFSTTEIPVFSDRDQKIIFQFMLEKKLFLERFGNIIFDPTKLIEYGNQLNPKITTKNRKIGIHLYFPFLRVNCAQALDIRENILIDLSENFQEFTYDEWTKIIDKSVFERSHNKKVCADLRMIGNAKSIKCINTPSCKGFIKEPTHLNICNFCNSKGKIIEERRYEFEYYLDQNRIYPSSNHKYFQNHEALLMLTSIRYNKPDHLVPKFVFPSNARKYVFENKKRKNNSNNNNDENALNNDEKLCGAFQSFINKDFRIQEYQHLRVKGYKTIFSKNQKNPKPIYCVQVHPSRFSYCQNVNHVHDSQNIFFEFHENGCYQRCFGTSDENCKNFKSIGVPLNKELKILLYSDENTITNEIVEKFFQTKNQVETSEDEESEQDISDEDEKDDKIGKKSKNRNLNYTKEYELNQMIKFLFQKVSCHEKLLQELKKEQDG